MNLILLSGGSGKRLWPLSNDIRSKQFIKIFKTKDGQYESMVQRVYRQILDADPEATVTIATSRTQVSSIHNQLGDKVGISVEPCRKDTFPAIALATRLREAGVRTQLYTEQKKFKQKMSYADKLGVPYILLLGEDEITQGKVSLKDMATGEQTLADADQAAARILAGLAAAREAAPIREPKEG